MSSKPKYNSVHVGSSVARVIEETISPEETDKLIDEVTLPNEFPLGSVAEGFRGKGKKKEYVAIDTKPIFSAPIVEIYNLSNAEDLKKYNKLLGRLNKKMPTVEINERIEFHQGVFYCYVRYVNITYKEKT